MLNRKSELRVVLMVITAVFAFLGLVFTDFNYFDKVSNNKIQVFKGDVVHFKWTADNVFYSKTCTNYGTAVDQYGGKFAAYKIVVLCQYQQKVEFIPLLIQAGDVLSTDGEQLQTTNSDLLE